MRDGSQAFQGVTKATITHGEAYEFLQLGTHLERADTTMRLLAVKVPGLQPAEPAAGHERMRSPACCARAAPSRPTASRSATSCAPRAWSSSCCSSEASRGRCCFCLEQSLSSIRAISGEAVRPERAIGRLYAELSFTDLPELDASTGPCSSVSCAASPTPTDEIAAGYFTTRVILPGPYAQQQQQQ